MKHIVFWEMTPCTLVDDWMMMTMMMTMMTMTESSERLAHIYENTWSHSSCLWRWIS